jgi:hypothetical protein
MTGPKGYWVARIDVQDEAAYGAYIAANGVAFAKFGARFIVRGGPGTGKSVVAINALVALIGAQKNAAYVSKNAAPREVYKGKLLGALTKSKYDSLFLGS